MRGTIVESFAQRWAHVNEMTKAFVQAVPDTYWASTPHPGFAPFCKQLRQVVWVRGCTTMGRAPAELRVDRSGALALDLRGGSQIISGRRRRSSRNRARAAKGPRRVRRRRLRTGPDTDAIRPARRW